MSLLERDLWDLVETKVVKPTNPMQLEKYKRKMSKSKQVILNSMKDHFILHVVEKTATREIIDALLIYIRVNTNQKMIMRNNLKAKWMRTTYTIVSYLMKITKV